jgi:hypothetical protein
VQLAGASEKLGARRGRQDEGDRLVAVRRLLELRFGIERIS